MSSSLKRLDDATLKQKILDGLQKITDPDTAPTYVEFGIRIGYIKRRSNPWKQNDQARALASSMKGWRLVDDRFNYEMCYINGEWRIIPYAIDQLAIDARLRGRSRQVKGQVKSQLRSNYLYEKEGKQNPKYNKKQVEETTNEIKESIREVLDGEQNEEKRD